MAYPFNNNMFGGYSGLGQNSYAQPVVPPQPNNQYQNYNIQPQTSNFGAKNFMFATEEELKSYILAPNSQMFGLDRANSILRVKTSDAMGNVTLEAYKLTSVDESKPNVTEVNQSEYLTKKDIENLVTRDELQGFMKQCKDIEKLLKVGTADERTEENN